MNNLQPLVTLRPYSFIALIWNLKMANVSLKSQNFFILLPKKAARGIRLPFDTHIKNFRAFRPSANCVKYAGNKFLIAHGLSQKKIPSPSCSRKPFSLPTGYMKSSKQRALFLVASSKLLAGHPWKVHSIQRTAWTVSLSLPFSLSLSRAHSLILCLSGSGSDLHYHMVHYLAPAS